VISAMAQHRAPRDRFTSMTSALDEQPAEA